MDGIAALRRLTDSAPPVDAEPSVDAGPSVGQLVERCELCSTALPELHRHLVELDERRIICACRPCALLFDPRGAGRGRYRLVPDRVLAEPVHEVPDALWDALELPVGMAFVFLSSTTDRPVACYPGPAGATESLLALSGWDDLREHLGLARLLQPDVEALLIRRQRSETGDECLLVPIDTCYELVGRLRMVWRGFDGGDEAARTIDAFFAGLRARAKPAVMTA